MPANSQQPGAAAYTETIDHFFDVSLYLLVLTGFVTLVSSGGLDLPAALMAGAALAFRGFLLVQRKTVVLPEAWTTPLTLGYFAFFAADYFLVSRSFLASTVHLALFGVVVRMFSLRRERDHLMLAILAFLMVLASAVLTVDSVFLFCFAGFMLMAVATFVLMEMRRSARAATTGARPSSDPQERRLAIWLVRLAPSLMLIILAGSAALFFVLPRMSAGYLGAYSFGTDFSTGFSDHVQLGQIGQIQQSNSVVMHIQIDGDTDGHHDLYWRGTALSIFDGHGWSNPRQQFILDKQSSDDFEIPSLGSASAWTRPTPAGAVAISAREKIIHYRVLMEPIGTNVFFLAPWARRVRGNYRLLSADSGAAVRDLDSGHPVTRYEAESDIGTPPREELRASGNDYPPEVVPAYLQLPALDPRVRSLATQIAGSSANNFDQAAAVEKYLRTHYGYTLQLPRTSTSDPLANFLFERRQGHCEYFASAMTVMLRTLGIPARVVNGFRSDEFNDLTANYVVRAKDAHAWVEAFFPGYGWQTFDPTPAGNAGTPQGWGRVALYVDAGASFWREWVVSYDSSHQYILGQTALNETHDVWERLRIFARQHYTAMLEWARRSAVWAQRSSRRSPEQWLGWAVGLALGLILLLLVVAFRERLAPMLRPIWINRRRGRLPQQAAALWYERMLHLLTRRGIPKPRTNTPREFVSDIKNPALRERVADFTEAYESARFGDSSVDADRLPALYEEIESATKR
jgi:protein-glutamine gamma-glutamyltransferase